MLFFEHIDTIDKIVSIKKEEERRKNLFDTSADIGGLGFSSTTIRQNGSMLSVTHDDGSSAHTDNYSVFDGPCGTTITSF